MAARLHPAKQEQNDSINSEDVNLYQKIHKDRDRGFYRAKNLQNLSKIN
jgi:hypothetical protein